MPSQAQSTPNLVTSLNATPTVHREEPVALEKLRKRADDRFLELGLPTSSLEQWRFTNLRPVGEIPYVPNLEANAGTAISSRWSLESTHSLVFVDGRFSAELSDTSSLPEGVVVCSLGEALRSEPRRVLEHLGQHAEFEEQSITALNTARWIDGAFIAVSQGVILDRPIALAYLSSPGDAPRVVFPRTLIVAERSSQFSVIESYEGRSAATLTIPVTELVLGADAKVDHYRIIDESAEANHVASQAALLESDSTLRSHSFAVAGQLSRIDIGAVLTGRGAEATLGGLYLVDEKRHVDHQVTVRHASAHTDSHQLFKGILTDNGRGVFNGRIIVDQDAQKTDAKQSNRNLLLSESARVNSNPQLEIFADDVRCTHGSTVGRLDEEAVFYLRTRGIDRATAEALLTRAFAGEVVEKVRLEELRSMLEDLIEDRLHQSNPEEAR